MRGEIVKLSVEQLKQLRDRGYTYYMNSRNEVKVILYEDMELLHVPKEDFDKLVKDME